MPIDLLHLARASRFLRSLLLTTSARPMWIRAIASVENLPGCPEDMSEPSYAALMFESGCQECSNHRVKSEIYYEGRFRVCKSCLTSLSVIHAIQTHYRLYLANFCYRTIDYTTLYEEPDAIFIRPLLPVIGERTQTSLHLQ